MFIVGLIFLTFKMYHETEGWKVFHYTDHEHQFSHVGPGEIIQELPDGSHILNKHTETTTSKQYIT